MDRINKNNYEAFFLDYHEGRLNSEESQMLLAFLQEHPEFYDEFSDYQEIVLPVPDIQYPDKAELFKTELTIPEEGDWEFKCIAFMEGDMTDEEIQAFEQERHTDPDKAKVLELYLATQSKPDKAIIYENKQALKKKVVLIPRWVYGVVSAAAVIILGWIIFTPGSEIIDNPQVASDSSRQIIYIDRIAHPGIFEKVASYDSEKPKILESTLVNSGDIRISNEALAFEDTGMVRDSHSFASLGSPQPGKVKSSYHMIPSGSSLFSYRYIPDAEDDEYQTLVAFSGDFIRKQLLGQDPELVKKSRFSLWELADVGLEKVSNIFGTGADIEREYNETGDLVAVSFESALVGFNTPVKRRSGIQID